MNKYIKTFDTDADYQSFISGEIDKPNLSYVKATNEVHYNPKPDYSKEYLTFEALENDTSFKLYIPSGIDSTSMTSISYSTDNGSTWVDTTIDNTNQTITTPTVNAGGKVLWKGIGTQISKSISYAQRTYFSTPYSTKEFNVSGNIMSLLYGDNFEGQTSFQSGTSYNLCGIFYTGGTGSCKIVSAEHLVLPATTLTNSCYDSMFSGCSSLATAPELPSTSLFDYCYHSMFERCTALTTAPELPATTLKNGCYGAMFNGCTSLTTAPVLNATTLVNNCYQYMFKDCTSLTTAPVLNATTLQYNCYIEMFNGCTNLNSIKMLATSISAINCLKDWVTNVAATGTFTKAASMTTLPTGTSGIPSGWTVVDA